MLDAVTTELRRMVDLGILEPTLSAPFGAAPIVPVVKKSGQIRICGDFKTTVNPYLEPVVYPLPLIDDLLARLNRYGTPKIFSKIDLAEAFFQVPLQETSKNLFTINTHLGLFKFLRLPFGITPAPAIFQKIIDTIVQDVEGCWAFEDDILVSGTTLENHLDNLTKLFDRLQDIKTEQLLSNNWAHFRKSIEHVPKMMCSIA